MESRGGDTARFDTQYPECYGLRAIEGENERERERERESRLSHRHYRLIVRYFLCRLVHALPTLHQHALSPPQNVNTFAYAVDHRAADHHRFISHC